MWDVGGIIQILCRMLRLVGLKHVLITLVELGFGRVPLVITNSPG